MGDISNNPFVGLRPFESDESLLFFGRQQQTTELLQRLHQYHFVAVVGGSGSGKSSLIRAGLIPGLKAGYLVNNSDKWIISVMKPGQSPLCNMADALLGQLPPSDTVLTSTGLHEKIKEEGADAVLNILNTLWSRNDEYTNTNFFLLIDQFEELFRFCIDQNDLKRKEEAVDFVNIILELSEQRHLPVYVVITMRSDFIGDCAQFYGLPEALNQSQYLVPRLNRVQLKSVIEGPVKLYNKKINPALTAKLLNDIQAVKDGLPLLQHTLMRVWDYEHDVDKDGELDFKDYDSVGGIEKALSNHADEALTGMSENELRITKKLFQALTTIDDNGRKVRKPVLMSELLVITGAKKEELKAVINRFMEDNRSFLVLNNIEENDDLLIDISHESLIRQWSALNGWVDEEAASGRIFLRLVDSTKLYKEKKKDLLIGNELQQVLQWYYKFHPTDAWAQRYSTDYENSVQYLKQSEQEWKAQKEKEEKQRHRKLRNLRLRLIAAIMVGVGFGISAYINYRAEIKTFNQLANNYWSNGQLARAESGLLESLQFIAEAVTFSKNKVLTQNILVDVEPFLPQTKLENILSHTGPVSNAGFSPDGKLAVTASYDSTVRIWNTESGAQIGEPIRINKYVNSAVFSPDGKSILTAGYDNMAILWNAVTRKQVRTFVQHRASVKTAVFSAGGERILTASDDSTAQVWNAVTGKPVGKPLQHAGGVFDAVFSADGKQVLTTSEDSTVRLWEAATGKSLGPGLKCNAKAYTAVFSADAKQILTAGEDSAVYVWDAVTWKLINRLAKQKGTVNSAVFSRDGKFILTACYDGTARIWNVITGKQAGPQLLHEDIVYKAVFSADGTQIITVCRNNTARIWKVAEEAQRNLFMVHHAAVKSAAFRADGRQLLTVCDDSTIHFWNTANGKQDRPPLMHNFFRSAVYSPDAKYILSTGFDSTTRLWDIVTGKQVGATMRHNAGINSLLFSADGKEILTAGSDGTARIWSLSGKQLKAFAQPQDYLYSAVFSPDGKQVLTASSSGKTVLWDVLTEKIISSALQPGVLLFHAAFNADGTQFITADSKGTARIWSTGTNQQIGNSFKHTEPLSSAAFGPGGKLVVTAGYDNTARLWDISTGKQLGYSFEHRAAVYTAAFSADGKNILTASADSTAGLWSIGGDLDMPASLFKLQTDAASGVELNAGTNELSFIPADRWYQLKKEYFKRGGDHYKTCKYPAYNLWKRFFIKEQQESGMQKKKI